MPSSSYSMTTKYLCRVLLGLVLTACGGETPSEGAQVAAPTASRETRVEQATITPAQLKPTAEVATGEPEAAPASIDVCALLTAAEAEMVVGMPVAEPQKEEPIVKPGGASTQGCRYRADAFNDLSVAIYHFNSAQAARAHYDILGDLGEDAESVEGLGDQASGTEHEQTRLGLLNILSGPYYLELGTLTDAENRLENLKAAGALLLDRLP